MKHKPYTICIICNDDRVSKWAYAFSQTEKFSRIFLVRSRYDFQELLSGNIDASLLAQDDLPTTFDGILFHSSNIDLWRSLSLDATHVLEFNTPGDPRKRDKVTPIKRQTAPYFGIKPQDIEELTDYIIDNRSELPLCCTSALRPQILPSMVCLFYLYFSQLDRGEQGLQRQFWHEIWGDSWRKEDSDTFAQAWKCQLEREWKHDWRLVQSQKTVKRESIEKLLKAFLTDVDAVTSALIDKAYHELKDNLGLSEPWHQVPLDKPGEIDSIIALSNRTANHALAAVLAHLWSIPYEVTNLREKSTKTTPRNTLLIVSESQVNQLKRIRLWGFSGAILVVSSDPFRTLKQRHRVLRFGQGSHESFCAPWDLEVVLPQLSNLRSLAPENLQLLQKEIKASELILEKHIEPFKKQLEFIDKAGQVEDKDIERLEEAISKIRKDLPVACHAVVTVTVGVEARSKQIQEHFQDALKFLRDRSVDDIRYGVQLFMKVFSRLQHYVIETW